MATVKVYDQQKREAGEAVLAPEIFEIEPRPEILNFVVRSQMAARRAGTHSTKTRGMVSGGGVKPYKQKGTGRARAGSNRSPIWRGGAIVFGPQPRDYSFKVNRKIRALALKMALSSKLAADTLMVVKDIELEAPKTKLFAKVAKDLDMHSTLIVLPEVNESLARAGANYPDVTMITENQLNVWGVLKHKKLILLEGAIEKIEERFGLKGEGNE